MSWLKRLITQKTSFVNKNVQFSSTVEQQTQALLIDHVYQQSLMGQITSFLCATVLLIGLYVPGATNLALMSWYIATFGIVIIRIIMMIFYKKNNLLQANLYFWQKIFVIGALLGGICWGFAGCYLFWYATSIQQTLIILILAGITAGAVPLLAADLTSAIVFLSSILFPLLVQLAFNKQNNLYLLFDVALTAYFIYMLLLAKRAHRLLKQTVGLQFEKEILEKKIVENKEKIDTLSQQLNTVETHDLMTGLANRKLFMIRLTEAIKRAEVSQKNLALLYLDLDNFKFVNDAYGYEIGDQLLKHLVKQMQAHLSDNDSIARVGGDEFGIILENCNTENLSTLASQICQTLAKPIDIEDYHLNVTVSIGISVYPADGINPDVLVKKADKAMQFIKEHGHNHFHFSMMGMGI